MSGTPGAEGLNRGSRGAVPRPRPEPPPRRPSRPTSRALAGGEIALGAELPVRVHDDAARDAELPCQVAGRGQTRPRPERSRPDRLPQLILDLRTERHLRVSAQREQELQRLVSFDTHGLDPPVGPVQIYSRRIESRRS